MMIYTQHYASPLGTLLLAADDGGLTGLWFEGAKYFAAGLSPEHTEAETPILRDTARWLNLYFGGRAPDFLPELHPIGSGFRQCVWRILRGIPCGQTMTYGEIAARLCTETGLTHMSAQAVGGAVGHNPISILIPCHRVVGSNGSLTGYAGGIRKKLALLELEHIDVSRFTIPSSGTAL